MAVRIGTNLASEMVQKNLRENSAKTDNLLNQLSSGKRVTQASDDAAGLAIGTNLEAQIKSLRQAERNANDGVSLVQTAEGGLNEISNIMIRLRELTIQAASDTVGDSERGFLDKEFQQLIDEVDRISHSTTFNGTHVINGSDQGIMKFQVGAFAGEENVIEFDSDAGDATADNLALNGVAISSKEDALDSIEYVDEAIHKISSQRAAFGALQSRLHSAIGSLDTQIIHQSEAKSKIVDVDIAHATAELATANLLNSAGMSALAIANNAPNGILKLIK